MAAVVFKPQRGDILQLMGVAHYSQEPKLSNKKKSKKFSYNNGNVCRKFWVLSKVFQSFSTNSLVGKKLKGYICRPLTGKEFEKAVEKRSRMGVKYGFKAYRKNF